MRFCTDVVLRAVVLGLSILAVCVGWLFGKEVVSVAAALAIRMVCL